MKFSSDQDHGPSSAVTTLKLPRLSEKISGFSRLGSVVPARMSLEILVSLDRRMSSGPRIPGWWCHHFKHVYECI